MQPSLDLEQNGELIICPWLTITPNKQFSVLINNFLANPYTLKKGGHISTFSTLTPEQANNIKPNNPALFRHLVDTNDNDAIQHVIAFSKMPQSEEFKKTHWIPTLQELGDGKKHTPIQKRLLQKLIALQKLKQPNLQNNQESPDQFLSIFETTDSTLDKQAPQAIEEIVVAFQDIFARHRFDIGLKNDFKVKLTPIDEIPAYIHNLPTPINMTEDVTV